VSTEGAGNVFRRLSHRIDIDEALCQLHIKVLFFVTLQSFISKSRESTVSESRQLADKITFICTDFVSAALRDDKKEDRATD
jgi:hypothetical protein